MTEPISDADRIEIQRRVVAEHVRGEAEKDWQATYDTYVGEESYIDAVALSARFRGLQGIKDFYAAFDSALPDLAIAVHAEYHTPGTSIIEVTLSGTQTGEFAGIPGSGRSVSVEACVVFGFGDGGNAGRMRFERVYMDLETLLRQCRGEEGPTGIGLADE